MTTGEVIDRLQAEGFKVSPYMVRHAVRMGKIPKPDRDYHGDFIFFTSHLEAMKTLWAKKRETPCATEP